VYNPIYFRKHKAYIFRQNTPYQVETKSFHGIILFIISLIIHAIIRHIYCAQPNIFQNTYAIYFRQTCHIKRTVVDVCSGAPSATSRAESRLLLLPGCLLLSISAIVTALVYPSRGGNINSLISVMLHTNKTKYKN
jgi:hypothetical protein